MSCTLESAIWSRDTGHQIPCFDRCQLIITWMSNIKEVNSKPRLHVSVNLLNLEYGRHLARLRRRRRRGCAYAPTSNTASHDNHEKIHWWVSLDSPYTGCLWGSAWRPFGPPELRYYLVCGRHLMRLHRRRRHAYTPTSNTASHDHPEKINSWVSFSFLYEYGAPLGRPSFAIVDRNKTI